MGKLPLTRFRVNSFNPFAGKAGRGGCKNKKKEDSTTNPKPAKKGSVVHKTAMLLELDSEDEELGQEKPLVTNKYLKFANVQRDDVRSVLDSKSLLSREANMLSQDLDKLILYSGTQQTWARHCSAWNLYNSFCRAIGIENSLPIDIKNAHAFVTWAITNKGLKSSSVKAYLGSLNVAHVISNSKGGNFSSDKCIKMALKGAENLEKIEGACKIDRLPMNYDLLAIFGHRLAKLNWSDYSKQIFWTATSISFSLHVEWESSSRTLKKDSTLKQPYCGKM